MKRYKYSLKIKFLVVMISLTSISFFIVSYFSIERTRQFGEYADAACSLLGQSAVDESKEALRSQAQEEIIAVTAGQAMLIDMQLKRIAVEISMITNLCSRYTTDPENIKAGFSQFRINFTDNEPTDYEKFGSWHTAPGYKQERLSAELNHLSRMQPVLKFVWRNNPGSDIVYLASTSGLFITYPWTRQPEDYDPRLRGWFNEAGRSSDVIWFGPYISSAGNKLVLTCAKAARDVSGRLIAVCAIDIEIKKIISNLLASRLEPSSRAILIDSFGDVLVQRDIDSAGKTWKEEFQKENMLKSTNPNIVRIAKNMIAGKYDIEELLIPGEPLYYFAYFPISTNGWSLGIAIPKNAATKSAMNTEKNIQIATISNRDSINEFISKTQKTYIVVGFSAIFLIVISNIFLSTRITRPILSLKNQAEQIGRGNFMQQIKLNTGDELEHLATTFNKMTSDLNEYIANLKETFVMREKINSELTVAKEIQSSSLPPANPENIDPAVNLNALMIPAREIGGDFYDYLMINPHTLYFAIGDVSGKGIPAALFMAMTKTLLLREAQSGLKPHEILFNVNNILVKNNESCMFTTTFCALLDLDTGIVVFANGGHNPPLLCRSGGTYEYLSPAHGMAIGPFDVIENKWCSETLQLNDGDILFLYSDGVTEAMNGDGTIFGEDQLRTALNEKMTDSLELSIANLMLEIKIHTGDCPQSDDITMVALRFNKREIPLMDGIDNV